MTNRVYYVVIGVLAVAVIAAAAFLGLVLHNRSHAGAASYVRQTGLPSNITDTEAGLMQLSPVPENPAPDFTFTDQNGKKISLSSLKGKDVVLNFMDPHCTDICPIVSQELVDANKLLGAKAKDVVFLAINVNQYNESLKAVTTFTDAHKLNTIPSFHFLTGTTKALTQTWSAYGVDVYAPSPTADVQHTSITYFINKQGQEQYVAAPTVDHTKSGSSYLPLSQIEGWASGIAKTALDLS